MPESLKNLFDRLKSLSLWDRVFRFKSVTDLSFEAYKDVVALQQEVAAASEETSRAQTEANKSLSEVASLKAKLEARDNTLSEIKIEHARAQQQIQDLQNDLLTLNKKVSHFESQRERREEAHNEKINSFLEAKNQVDGERRALQEQREKAIQERFERMKAQWARHETEVEEVIKNICKRHQVEYIDKEKTPFRGKPDNTVLICGEYIIFDAKSPQGDDLKNFAKYVQTQAEQTKKYAKQENVKSDLFLVVPANAIHAVSQYHYNFADHTVFVITVDALEPILLSLKKIEDYEFAESLSPDERDNICRVLGKLLHASKRRIQVDAYFWQEFLNTFTGLNTLPSEFRDKVLQFEQSTKINPPQEKRVKRISEKEMREDIKLLEQDAMGKGINVGEIKMDVIETVPLYTKSNESAKK